MRDCWEQDGILHFKVSCGHQLITFSDPKHKVDSGNSSTTSIRIFLKNYLKVVSRIIPNAYKKLPQNYVCRTGHPSHWPDPGTGFLATFF
jgi:hypothetical protein